MGFKPGAIGLLKESDFRRMVNEASSLNNLIANAGLDCRSEGTRLSVIGRLVNMRWEPLHWTHNPLASLEKNYLRLYDRTERKSRPNGYQIAYNWVCPGDHCELCDLGPMWNGKRTVFEIDHINGNAWNCLTSNLRRLCPNCHRQQITSSSGNGMLFTS